MKIHLRAYFLIHPFLLLFNITLQAQTSVEGFIKDGSSGEPIMFAHIFFKGTQIGTTSDTTGFFRLQTNRKVDSLVVSYLGYFTERVAVKPNAHQKIDIGLRSQFIQLSEVEVVAGENPAWAILENVVKAKPQNNPESQHSYYCEEYSKIRFDLNHFTEKIKQNIMLRPFDFIWENVDTTADGVTYLPVLFVEKNIDHYYQRNPRKIRDYVNGVNATGLKGPKIMKFVEDLYLTPNIYDNFVVMLDKSFPSPIHDNFKTHYQYVLQEDSIVIDNVVYYRIAFQPKYKRELAFTGEMLIHAASYAVKQIELRFDIMANVNFVRSYWVSQTYEPVDGKSWMPVSSQVLGDFTVLENSAEMTGFFGRKNSTYRNYKINTELPKDVLRGTELVVEADSAYEREKDYWNQNRHAELTDEEAGVFSMVERLEQDPAFIIRKNIVLALVTGYVPLGKFDIGDFYTFYSYNVVEHSRLKFGFRSNKDWSSPFAGSVYGAYGTRDEKWKYGIKTEWNFGKRKQPKRLGISYRKDIEQLGRSFNNIEIDHILTSFVQYGEVASRNYVTDLNVYAESTWSTGFLTRLSYFYNTTSPTQDKLFNVIDSEGNLFQQQEFKATGVGITLKYSWQNYDINGNFYARDEKKITFRKYPDIGVEWRWADEELFNAELDFHKISLQLKQNVRLQKLGYFQYYLESGKTFGTVPYPYLNIPFGNQLVFQDNYAFNLMNFLEYASDEFITLYVQHHFDGLILDRIPIINRLKWRSLIFARAYWGNLSDKNNQQVYLFPENLNPVNSKGYYEVGFGIENIFKISRIDFTWRLTDTTAPGVYTFIVKPSFRLAF